MTNNKRAKNALHNLDPTPELYEYVRREDGHEYSISVWFTEGFPAARPHYTLYRATPLGIVGRAVEEPVEAESMVFPAAPSIGQQWTWKRFGGTVLFEVTGIEVPVETPAGRFKCREISMDGTVNIGSFSGKSFFAKKVGMVKQIESYCGFHFEYLLVDCHPLELRAAPQAVLETGGNFRKLCAWRGERVRLISARKATRAERRRYEKEI